MLYLGYITLYLLQTKLETTVQTQMPTTPEPLEITTDDLWADDTVFPKDGPVFIHGLQQTNHYLTRKASNQKDEEKNIERRFGPLVDLPGIEPKSYHDPYSLALGPHRQGHFDVAYTAPQERIEKAEKNKDIEIISKGQDALPRGNAQTTMTVGVYAFYLNETQTYSTMHSLRSLDNKTRSTMPFIHSDTRTHSTVPFIHSDTRTHSTMPFIHSGTRTHSIMPFIYSGPRTRSTMPYIYSATQTRSTMPFIYSDTQTRSTMPFIYSLAQTRSTTPFIYSVTQTRSTMPFIYSDTQTRSTMPFPSSENTITTSKFNKKIYSATERKIIRNMPIQRANAPFINVYNYMQNHHVTSPDGKDDKKLKRPLKYNIKPRPFDNTRHSIMGQERKYFDYEASETPIERYDRPQMKTDFPKIIQKFHATQKNKSWFMKDDIKRFSESTTKSVKKSGIQGFKEPLQKLASMKASFYNGEGNPFKKEIELVNNIGNIFNEPYSTSTVKVNERFKNAPLLRSNTDPPKVERLDNTDVTQTEWYPWIKTGTPIHNRASFNVPEIETTGSPIYKWILTKMFPVLTTERYQKLTSAPTFIYEYKELDPKKALRIRPETTERLNSDKQERSQEIQVGSHRLEPDLDSQVTGAQEQMESDPFSMFLAKLMKTLASKSLTDLKGLVSSFERSITTLLDSGKLMKLGMTTGSFIAQMTTLLIAPMKEIQRQIFIMQVSLENRHRMLDEGFNVMLDELDNVYDVSEEEAMQRILRDAMIYPNTSKTGEQIVQEFIEDVFLHPINRIAGTAHGNVVFENIAKVANKYNTPQNLEPMARRYENQYQITKYNKFPNSRVINEEHRFIHSHSTKYQGRRQNKHFKKKVTDIESHLDDEEDEEDESSSNDNPGVEIKIHINNRKHSKRNKRKIVKKHTENNIYTRRTYEYDHELFATENTEMKNYGLSNADLRKYAKYPTKKHFSGRKSNLEETGLRKTKKDDREIVKSKVDSKVTDKSKVTLQFNCEPLPVILSNQNNTNRDYYTNLTESEMIMYCSNANANN